MSEVPPNCVLDASALIALLKNEPGGEQVDRFLMARDCVMSSVNLAEFVSKMVREEGNASKALEIVRDLPLTVTPYGTEDAAETGALALHTRHLGLSLGDRACLALAKKLDALAVTTDRPWLQLDIGVKIECVRPDTGRTGTGETRHEQSIPPP